ncbi:hypothetical protein [Haladaptatus cibarius]|nr:hypothetical protein [Haladaptatus cibarius]
MSDPEADEPLREEFSAVDKSATEILADARESVLYDVGSVAEW